MASIKEGFVTKAFKTITCDLQINSDGTIGYRTEEMADFEDLGTALQYFNGAYVKLSVTQETKIEELPTGEVEDEASEE